MAATISNPTANLETALAEFQGVLSAEDKLKLKTLQGKPTVDAAIQFTASLDRENTEKRKGPSLGSRLYSLLLSVQQFSSVVDTFVSSNPPIAALVVINFITQYEELSRAFLDFDKWAPRFSEYQLLFPSSTRLQSAICHFHAAIIRCCKQIFIILQRSWQAQLLSSITKSFLPEVQEHVRLIKDRGREVDFEIALAKAQSDYHEQRLQAEERKSASSHRDVLTSFVSKTNAKITEAQRWRTTLDNQRKGEGNQRRLDAISTFDHISAFKQARSKRYHGTGGWVFETSELLQWRQREGCQVLWLSGKTRAYDLLVHRQVSDSVALFFSRFDNARSLQADTIIRSLIRQNLQVDQIDKLSNALTTANNTLYNRASITELLSTKLSIFSTNYILIDALDECEISEGKLLLAILSSACCRNSSRIKIFIASRSSLEDEILQAFPQASRIRMGVPDAISDLALYTRDCLNERLSAGQLSIGSTVSVEDICQALLDKAHGIFLWVALEIDDICSQVCEEDIRLILQDLPTTLTDIFTRALKRIIKQKTHRVAKDVFKWIAVTKRPLLLGELQDALSIRIGEAYSKRDIRPMDIKNVPAWCANLIEIDELSGSVQFVHHTVQTFITDTSVITAHYPEVDQFHQRLEDMDVSVGELCVTYLEWNDFQTALRPSNRPIQTIAPDPRALTEEILNNQWRRGVARKISKLVPRSSTDGIRKLEHPSSASVPGYRDNLGGKDDSDTIYPFLAYASEYWVIHTRLLMQESIVYMPWRRMISGEHHIARTQWTPDEYAAADDSIWRWARIHRHLPLLKLMTLKLLELVSLQVADMSEVHRTICLSIAETSNIALLEWYLPLIQKHAPAHWTEDMLLVMKTEATAAYLLSPEKLDLVRQGLDYLTLLSYRLELASWKGNWNLQSLTDRTTLLELSFCASVRYGITHLMIEVLAIDSRLGYAPHWLEFPPLELAIRAEDIFAVMALLERGADPNVRSLHQEWYDLSGTRIEYESLLHLAICMQNKLTFVSFLEKEANAVDWKPNFQTRIFGPVDNGPWYLSGRLDAIDAIDVNMGHIINSTGITVTHEVKITEDPNERERSPRLKPIPWNVQPTGRINVSWIIPRTDIDVIKALIRYGADLNARDSNGMTPLHYAVLTRNDTLLKHVLVANPRLAMSSRDGETPLDLADRIGFGTDRILQHLGQKSWKS